MFLGTNIVLISACVTLVHPWRTSSEDKEFILVEDRYHKTSCPAEYEQNDNVIIFAHDSDCSKYYICENGRPVARPCPGGLEFNSKLEVCDYPHSANCHHDEKEDAKESQSFEGSGDPGPSTEEVPHSSTETATEPSLEQETELSTDEENQSLEEEDAESPVEANGRCPHNQKIAFFRHPSFCHYYYKCVKGRKYLKRCKNGLHFNLEWRRCTIPSFANCHF